MPYDAHGRVTAPGGGALGGSKADDFALRWIGLQVGAAQRRQVIGLVCDTAHHPDDADARARLARHAGEVSERYGGRPMPSPHAMAASWGYTRATEEDARLAVQAALQIAGAAELKARCALDASIVVAGETGSANVSALETATRLLELASPNSVIASDTIRRLSAGAFDCEPYVPAAGQEAGQVLIWRVLGPRTRWRRSDAEASAHLFGRDEELEQLSRCWQQVRAGSSLVALLRGEAGIGKSAMVAGLSERVAESGGVWIEGECLPETRHAPLAPVREAMRELAATGLGALSEEDRHALDLFAGLGEGARPDSGSEAPAPPAPLVELMVRAIAGVAARRPVALVFEDLHWADQTSLALLAALAARRADLGRALIVCTGRQPMPPVLEAGSIDLDLTLDRLTSGNVIRMLAAKDFAASLDAEAHRAIADRSEGVPLFAVELARLWAETGGFSATDDLLAGPSSLNATLAARLDALDELKPLAQAAAVLGRDFDVRVLATTLEMDATSLARRLDLLAERGIVAPTQPHCYRFSHSLLRDAAMSSLPEERRRTLHGRTAEALTIESHNVNPEVVAGHYLGAGDFRHAFIWWRRAAERSASIASAHSAAANLQRALAAKADRGETFSQIEEVEVLRLLGVQLTQLKGSAAPETLTTYQRALDLIGRMPGVQPELRFDLFWGLDACHLVRGDVRNALALGEALLTAAAEERSEDKVMLAQRMHAVAKLLSGAIGEAIDLYCMALRRYDQARHGTLRFGYASDQGAVAHAHLTWALAIAGQPEEAQAHSRAALTLAGRLDHPHTSAHVVCVLAAAAQILGERGIAAALGVAGRALGNRHDFPYWSAWAGLVLGWVEGARTPDKAALRITEAIDAYRATGARQALPYGYLLLGCILLRARRAEGALEALERAWSIGERHELRLYAAEILRLRARAEARLGADRGRVAALLEQAIHLARGQGALTFAARAERTAQRLTGKQVGEAPAHAIKPATGQASLWFPSVNLPSADPPGMPNPAVQR